MTDTPKFAFPFRRTAAVLPTAVNLVPNGSFQYDATGGDAMGWLHDPHVTVQASYWGSSSPPAPGSNALMTDNAAASWAITQEDPQPVDAGVDYTARVAYYQISSNANGWDLYIRWLDANGAIISSVNAHVGNVSNGGSGVETVSGVAPAEAVSAYVEILHATDISNMYFDGFMLAPTDQGTTYVDGDTAGWGWTGTPGNSRSQIPGVLPSRKVIVVEQDSLEHIDACAQVVIRCPIGFRDEMPEFGWPFPEFDNIPLSTAPIEEALQQFGHPAGHPSASEYGDIIDQSVRYMRVVEQAQVDARRETE